MFSRRSPVEVEGKVERPRSATTFDNQSRSRTMKRITFALAAAVIFGALTIALPKLKSGVKANPVANPSPAQIGPDACKNVKFKFTNLRSDHAKMRLVQVEYYIKSKDRWRTENVSLANGADCNYGATCATTGNNLADSLDRDLTKFHLIYKYLPNTVGANWSSQVKSQELTPDNPRCSDNRTYGPGSQGWTIPPQ
jgi:hypothetical protein